LSGFQTYAGGKENLIIIKTYSDGTSSWTKTYGSQQYRLRGQSIVAIPNGDLVIAGISEPSSTDDRDIIVLKVDDTGGEKWSTLYDLNGPLGGSRDDDARAIISTPDGSLLLAGTTNVESSMANSGFILKIESNGGQTPILQKLFLNNEFSALGASGSNLFVSGFKSSSNDLDNLVLLKLNLNAEVICEAIVGRGGFDQGLGLVPVRGGVVVAGSTEQFVSSFGESYAYLIKADVNCTVLTSYIQANIFHDFNNNCVKNLDETGLSNWVIRLESAYDTLYTVANTNGDLKVEVDTGNYKLILLPPNPYWKSCDSILNVYVSNFYDTVYVNLPVKTLFDCPRNEVDVATPLLRRCTDNVYSIRYCNSGTVPSLNTQVDVALDPFLTFTGSSINAIPLGDNIFRFNIGTLNNGDCGDFSVKAFLNCDDTQTGQTHCVIAQISPSEFCGTNSGWDGAIIAAKAFCENDSVKMLLENIGTGAMGGPLGYVITEDVVMLTPPGSQDFKFDLDAGQSQVVWSHLATGKTFRIIAEQSPGYPGTSYPTAAVEGCQTDTSTSEISLGFYTMFPEDDADAFVESDCQESNDSDFNPLYLKRGHPKGFDVPHYVTPQTDLEYIIQFQNTGADTVQQVVIRDTLSAALDPATVYPGTASHPYQFDILGDGVVVFTLSNLNLLPGGSVPSEGFVKFRVSQKPNLPCETKILNSAAIFFDFNAPVFSNTIYNTVCDSFLLFIDTKEIYVKGAQLDVYPNPASESVNFNIVGVDAESFDLLLYNIQGRLISNYSFTQPEFRIFRNQIPAGEIIYQISVEGKPIASGKLILR
jgi:uncharacterized repeat protein (TIGR01451 family)